MYEINPENVGWQYLKSRKMLPKYREVYSFVNDPGRYPRYCENINIVQNDTGIYMYPSVTLAKNLCIDKTAFANRFRSNMVDARACLGEAINPGTKALFFPNGDRELIALFFSLRESVANTPRLHRMAKIIIS